MQAFDFNEKNGQIVKGASIDDNGRGSAITDELCSILANPHDIIKFFSTFTRSNIDEFRRLYESGRSLKEISDEHGIARSSLRDQLIKSGVEIRAISKIQILTRKKPKREHWGAIPYGYCILDGKLVIQPNEIKNVRKIIGQWQKLKSFNAVAKWLNGQNIKSKLGKKWSDKTVASVVRRFIKTDIKIK